MQGLANAPVVVTPLTVSTGSHGTASFARGGSGVASLDLFDVGGRRIVTLAPMVNASGCAWSWDGQGASGAPVGAAVLFARARDGIGGVAKLVRLP